MDIENERLLYTNNCGRKSFQWEIWPLCNSKCSFCVHPETKITMADTTHKKVKDIVVGDEVLGVIETEEGKFKCIPSKVLAIATKPYKGILYKERFTPDHKILATDFKTYKSASEVTSGAAVYVVSKKEDPTKYTIEDFYTKSWEKDAERFKRYYEGPVYDLQTETENFVACRLIVHNCYLGVENTLTNKERQMKSLNDCWEAIHNIDFNKYNNISFIGGEFFQGQLKDPEIKEMFFKIMREVGQYYLDKKIGSIWITTTLTIGDQEDLYELMDMFDNMGIRPKEEYGASGLWLCTSWDAEGRFHSQKMKDNWEYHMKSLKEKYPWVKFNTTIILMSKLCEMYLSGEFQPKKFMEEFNTTLFYKQCGIGNHNLPDKDDPQFAEKWQGLKEKVQKELGYNFFPTRELFCKFLSKYAIEDRDTYDRLFNIYYRADELHRNFNDQDSDYSISRIKGSKIESSAGEDSILNTCGHGYTYAPYIDGDGCCICDRDMIFNSTEGLV